MTEDSLSGDDFSDTGYDSLFGGEKLISLFDKTIGVGVERTGIITKAPETRQSRFYSAAGNGKLKYWGEDGKPTENSRSINGEPLNPCNDEVFVLQTEYRASRHDLEKRDMDEDNGFRGVFASGAQFRAIKQAIRDAKVKNRQALVGMRLTLVRTGQVTRGDFEAWTWDAKLSGTQASPPPIFDEADA